jgi:hypothetical protein
MISNGTTVRRVLDALGFERCKVTKLDLRFEVNCLVTGTADVLVNKEGIEELGGLLETKRFRITEIPSDEVAK